MPDSDGDYGSSTTSFTAALTDPNGGSGTATVTYTTGAIGGVSAAVLSITGDTTQEGQSESVVIGTTTVGTVSIDSSGSGTLLIQPSVLAAAVASGTGVSVGTLTGSFAPSSSSTGSGGGCMGSGSSSTGTNLTSTVTNSAGNAATVTYQTGHLLGTQESVIKISGDTTDEGTSVEVSIGGTQVGSISVDSTGSGTLIVPSSTISPAAAAGTSVAVGATAARSPRRAPRPARRIRIMRFPPASPTPAATPPR